MNTRILKLLLFSAAWLMLVIGTLELLAKEKKGATERRPQPPDGGTLVLPANGIFDPQQGTFETVFCLNYSFGDDVLPPGQSSIAPFRLFYLAAANGTMYGKDEEPIFSVAAANQRSNDYFAFASGFCYSLASGGHRQHGFPLSGNPQTGPWPKAGEWHALAVTWQRADAKFQLQFFYDGVLRNQSTMDAQAPAPVVRSTDLFFVSGLTQCQGSIRALRFSGSVRSAEEIATAAKAGLVRDAATTFFLDGTTAAKIRKLPAKKLADYTDTKSGRSSRWPAEGLFFGEIEIVKTPAGPVIQFHESAKPAIGRSSRAGQ